MVCQAREPYWCNGEVGHCYKGSPATEEEEKVDGIRV